MRRQFFVPTKVFLVATATLLLAAPLLGEGLDQGIKSLAMQISDTMKTSNIRKIAVIQFGDLSGRESALGDFIAEELITQLFVSTPGRFDVVERSQLKKVLGEQKLGTTGIFDQSTIANVGKILGIEAMITGTTSDFGDEIRISARLIAVDSAKIFAAASVTVPKDKAVLELLHQGGRAYGLNTEQSGHPRPDALEFFENETLRIEVQGTGYTKGSSVVTLTLKVINKTSDELYLAVGLRDYGIFCDLNIADDRGNAARVPPADVSGLTCVHQSQAADRKSYLAIAPSMYTILILKFTVDDPGDTLNLAGSFWIFHENGNPVPLSAGIPGIHLTKKER